MNRICNTGQLEVFFENRSTYIRGNSRDTIIQDLCDSVVWFRGAAKGKVSKSERLFIEASYATLERQIERIGLLSSILLPLGYFLPHSSSPKPQRVGLEAEYARFVRPLEPALKTLKYNQLVGDILIPKTDGNKLLARLKLDGLAVDKKSAILELELRPYSLDSTEFSQQLQIIEKLRKAILQAERGFSVQGLLDRFSQESSEYEIQVERDNLLVFDAPPHQVGPFCQVTIELPLSSFGDPTNKAILDLVENPAERDLLQHARIAAANLIEIVRPLATKLHGNIYESSSIKLLKLRGYWAQIIMQACQVIHYEKDKTKVGFHIRAAGPRYLGFREKVLLRKLFDHRQDLSERFAFQDVLKQALEDGIRCLAAGGHLKDHRESVQRMLSLLMKDDYSFEPRCLQFKSQSLSGDAPDNLEFSYGMTLVELRHVHSSLNRGIIERDLHSYSRIKNAQTLPNYNPKKAVPF